MTPPRWNLATACAGVSTPNRVRFSAETVSAVAPVTYGTNSWPTFCSSVIEAMVASIEWVGFFGEALAGRAAVHTTVVRSATERARRGEKGMSRTYEALARHVKSSLVLSTARKLLTSGGLTRG